MPKRTVTAAEPPPAGLSATAGAPSVPREDPMRPAASRSGGSAPRPAASLRRWCQRLVERSLGIRIYRHPPMGRYFYPQLTSLRAWSPGDVIFDVGANDGRTVVELRRHLPSPTIYAFEPVAATFRQLVERTSRLGDVRPVRLALGDESGQRDIYLHDVAATNSFTADWDQAIGRETVSISTVDDFMTAHGIPFVHFLKIDTEGHEMAVLRGARGTLDAARVAILQVEVGVGHADRAFTSLEEVRSYLAPKGYYLYGVFNQCTRVVQGPPAWSVRALSGYRPRVLAYCDAIFLAAAL